MAATDDYRMMLSDVADNLEPVDAMNLAQTLNIGFARRADIKNGRNLINEMEKTTFVSRDNADDLLKLLEKKQLTKAAEVVKKYILDRLSQPGTSGTTVQSDSGTAVGSSKIPIRTIQGLLPVPGNVLRRLSREISSQWHSIGYSLELDIITLEQIELGRGSLQEKAHKMLIEWTRKKKENATYRILGKALRSAEREDLEEYIYRDESEEEMTEEKSEKGKMKSFGSFKLKLEDTLSFTTVIRLANLFEYPLKKIEELENTTENRNLMICYMEAEGQIQPTDITSLLNGLKKLDLPGIESTVRKLFEDHTGIRCTDSNQLKQQSEASPDSEEEIATSPEMTEEKPEDPSPSKSESSTMGKVVTSEDIQKLSKSIGNDWRNIGRRLDFSEADLQNLEKDHDQQEEVAMQMLFKWTQKKGDVATYDILVNALIGAGRADLGHALQKGNDPPSLNMQSK